MACGALLERNGFQLTEAFNFALQNINSKKGQFANVLKGVKLGGVALDACASPAKAATMTGNLQSGKMFIKTESDDVLNPSNIHVYIAGPNNPSSRSISYVLNDYGIPQISYAATSIDLNNKIEHPYFLRSVPSDKKQARALAALLKKYNLQYIQLVSSTSPYGTALSEEFKIEAKQNGICVAQHIVFEVTKRISVKAAANNTVDSLLKKTPAKVVVVALEKHYLRDMFEAFDLSKEAKSHKFLFIGTDSWERDSSVTSGLEEFTEGSITLGLETVDVGDFDDYLFSKHPSTYKKNLWFDDWYQWVFECNLPGKFTYSKSCPDRTPGRPSKYNQDKLVFYTINAVYTAALGIHKALEKQCGKDYDGVCDEYKNSKKKLADILEGMKTTEFTDYSNRPFSFSGGVEGSRGYHVFRLTKGDLGQYHYDSVSLQSICCRYVKFLLSFYTTLQFLLLFMYTFL